MRRNFFFLFKQRVEWRRERELRVIRRTPRTQFVDGRRREDGGKGVRRATESAPAHTDHVTRLTLV